MIDCQKANEYIDLYIDQRLSDDEKHRLFLHIDSCEACRKELDRAVALGKMFGELEDMEPPAGLAASAIKKAKKRKFPVFIYASAGVAAAAVLIAVLAIGLGGGVQNSEMDRTTNDMALSMPVKNESVSESDMAAGSAESDIAMDMAAEDEDAGVSEDTLEAAPQEQMETADAATDDMALSSNMYYVPTDVSGPFWDALDSFLKENDIPTDYAYDGADNISFYVEEAYLDGLNVLTNEYGISGNALMPGMYVTYIFNVE